MMKKAVFNTRRGTFTNRSIFYRNSRLVYPLSTMTVRFFSDYPDYIPLEMPALSPTMEIGGIATWLKKEGDHVNVGEVMAEVETDKATVAWESVEEGYIAKILLPDGSNDITVGTLAGIFVEEEEDIAAFRDFVSDGEATSAPVSSEAESPPEPVPKAEPASSTLSDLPEYIPLEMPALSPTMERGGIASWEKAEGDYINVGEVMAEVETDKATVAWESVEEGYLAKIILPAGTTDVEVGTLAGIFVEEEEDIAAFKDFSGDIEATPAPAPSSKPEPVAPSEPEPTIAVAPATPAAPAAPATPARTGGESSDLPHTNIRKVIAGRLTQSKQEIPHYYLTIDVQMDEVLKIRKTFNSEHLQDKAKISVNDFIIKASSLALKDVPEANSSWFDDVIRQYNYVDICVAVATDDGLITPIVKNADRKRLTAISADVRSLASKARENKLQPHEYQGGTFTISNLGMMGVDSFTAIINPPQACILAVGTTEERIIDIQNTEDGEAAYTVGTFMTVTLSCDHRVIDGAVGAKWLGSFKKYMEDPLTLLL